ncbi:MAG: hypothetical protein V1934_06470 [Methanobacteriota archaeon]
MSKRESGIECPVCGASNPTGDSECKECGFIFEADRAVAKPPVAAAAPKGVVAPSSTRECPSCMAIIEASDAECPICGEKLVPTFVKETGQEISCKSCGALLDSSLTVCPICGEGLVEVREEPAPEAQADEFTCSNCGSILSFGMTECPVCGVRFDQPLTPPMPVSAVPAEPVEIPMETPEPAVAKDESWDLGSVGGQAVEPADAPYEPEQREEPAAPGIDAIPEEPMQVAEEPPMPVPSAPPEAVPAKVKLADDEFACPSCSVPVKLGTDRCESCWADVAGYVRCPSCGTASGPGVEVCPDCFAKLPLAAAPTAMAPEPELEVPEDKEEPSPKEGDADCPSCGSPVLKEDVMCADCGMILINEEEPPVKKREPRKKPIQQLGVWEKRAVIIVIALLMSSALMPFIFSLPQVERDRIIFDGSFDDWGQVRVNHDDVGALPSEVDITAYQVISDGRNIYFSETVLGNIFSSVRGETMRVFADTDRNPATGYSIRGTGADYMVRVYGWGGVVRSASCLRFATATNQNDFTAFQSHATAYPYASGNQTEVRVLLADMGMNEETRANIVFYMGNSLGQHDFSDLVVSNIGGVLNVRQVPSASVLADGWIPVGTSTEVMTFEMAAAGQDISLTGLETHGLVQNRTLPLMIADGNTVLASVIANPTAAQAGDVVEALFAAADFTLLDGSTAVTGGAARAYAGQPAAGVTIDGAFADWRNEAISDDPTTDVMDRSSTNYITSDNINILGYASGTAASAQGQSLNVYVNVAGHALGGTDVPVEESAHLVPPSSTRSQATPSASQAQSNNTRSEQAQTPAGTRQAAAERPELAPPAPKAKTGEDAILVLLDTDNRSATGYLAGGLGADMLLEVKGREGKVTSTILYGFSGADQRIYSWNAVGNGTAACTGSEIEVGVLLSDIGIAAYAELAVLIHVVDWKEDKDAANVSWDAAGNALGTTRAPAPPNQIYGWVKHANNSIANGTTLAVMIAVSGIASSYVVRTNSTTGGFFFNFPSSYNGRTASFYTTDGTANWGLRRTVLAGNFVGIITKDFNITMNRSLAAYAPKDFMASTGASSDPEVKLRWTATGLPPSGNYRIFRGTTLFYDQSDDAYDCFQFTPQATTSSYGWLDSNVSIGGDYFYYVAAVNGTSNEMNSTFLWNRVQALPESPYTVYGVAKNPDGTRIQGVNVEVRTWNGSVWHIFNKITDPTGGYLVTLQPDEYLLGSEAHVNGTLGDASVYNLTAVPYIPGIQDDKSPCNLTLGPPPMEFSKTVDEQFIVVGETLHYTIWFNNTGTVNASQVWINDTLPQGVVYAADTAATSPTAFPYFVSRTGPQWVGSNQEIYYVFVDVTPGNHYFQIDAVVNVTGVLNGTMLTNWAYMNWTTDGTQYWTQNGTMFYPDGLSDSATSTALVTNVVITKDVDLAVANAGDYLVYTVTFSNAGGVDASFVWVNDTLPNVPPGAVTYVSDTALSLGALFLSSTTWTTPLQYVFQNVPPGAHAFTITARIATNVPVGTALLNNASCTYAMATTSFFGPWDTAQTTVVAPSIAVGKTVDLPQARPGDALTYTIRFDNNGNDVADRVWINDTLDTDTYWETDTSQSLFTMFVSRAISAVPGATLRYVFGNVPVGAHQFTITARIRADALTRPGPDGWAVNSVELDFATNYTSYAQSSASAQTEIIAPAVEVAKDVSAATASPGDPLVYTIAIYNNGTAPASYVWINDTLPAGVTFVRDTAGLGSTAAPFWSASSNASNPLQYVFRDVPPAPGVYSFQVFVTILGTVMDGTCLTNWVYCDYAPQGVQTFDNATTVVRRPIIDVDKAADPGIVYPGSFLNYTIWFNNTGGGGASYTWLNDTLPLNAQYVSDTNASVIGVGPPATTWTHVGNVIRWVFRTVQPGIHSFTITMRVSSAAAEGDFVVNTVLCAYEQANGLKFAPSSATAIAAVLAGPIIGVTKAADHNPVLPGDVLTYQITFNNGGNQVASRVWLNETLPAGVAYISDTNASVTSSGVGLAIFVSRIGNSIRWVFYDVAPGAHSFQVSARVNLEVEWSVLSNYVRCEYLSSTGVYGPDTWDWANVTVLRPNITVVKNVDRAFASPGDLLTYTVSFANTGSVPSIVRIVDDLPLGVSYFTDDAATISGVITLASKGTSGQRLWFNFTNVQPGPHSFNVVVQIRTNVTAGTILVNNALLNYTAENGHEFAGSRDNATTIVSDMVVVKSASRPSVGPGDFLNFTIWFNNTGNMTCSYVWINDTLPAWTTYVTDTAASLGYTFTRTVGVGFVRYAFRNISANSFNSFTIALRVNASVPPGTWVNNTVVMNYTDAFGNLLPGSQDVAPVRVDVAVVGLAKTVDLPVAYPDDLLTYTIWFNNTGTIASPHVWINDTLPSWVTLAAPWSLGGTGAVGGGGLVNFTLNVYYAWHFLNVGVGTHFITLIVRINPAAPSGMLVNLAESDYDNGYGTMLPRNDTATTLVIRPYISVNKAGPGQALPGDWIRYWINFTVTGAGIASMVWINDTLPAELGFITHNADASLSTWAIFAGFWQNGQDMHFNFTNVPAGSYSFWMQVAVSTSAEGEVTNTAYLDYSIANGYVWHAQDDAMTDVVRPHITISKTVNLAEAYPNDILVYTIYYNNTGGAAAAMVIVTDVLPNWVSYIDDTSGVTPVFDGLQTYDWTFMSVTMGLHSFQVRVRVNSTTPHCQTLVNTASLTYSTISNVGTPAEFEPSIDAASTHINRPLITVDKIVDYAVAAPGAFLNYTIAFDNNNPEAAFAVWINDTLPAGVIYVTDTSAAVVGATLASSGRSGQFMWFNFTNVLPGAHAFTVTVRINPVAVPGTTLTNWAHLDYAAANGFMLEPSEDTASTLISAMGITKDVDLPLAVQGDTLTYTITFENTAASPAMFVWINDTLPMGVTYVSDTAFFLGVYGGGPTFSGQVVRFWFQNVPQGVYTFDIVVTIDASVAPGTWLNNTARLDWANELGGIMPSSQDGAETKVAEAVVDIAKSASVGRVYPGQQFTYTIWFNNSGETDATWVSIVDFLPSGVVYQSNTAGAVAGATFLGPMAQSGRYLYFNFTGVLPGAHSFTINLSVSVPLDNVLLVNQASLNYSAGSYQYQDWPVDWANVTLVMPIMTVDKTPEIQPASWGDLVTFTITFSNTGHGTASWVWINDTLPSGLFYVSDTSDTSPTVTPYFQSKGNSGQSLWFNFTDVPSGVYSFTLTVRVGTGIADGTALTNTVDIRYNTPDWNAYPVDSDEAWVIVQVPSIAVQKDVNRNVASPGSFLTYTISFNNVGSWPAARVWINDTLPAGVQYWSDNANLVAGATFLAPTGVSGRRLYFNFTNVVTGLHSFQVVAYVLPTVTNGTTLTNWAFLNYTLASGYRMPPSQDDASTLVTIMAVAKVVGAPVVRALQTVTYTIHFNNTAAFPITYAWLNDTLPAGTTYANDTAWTVANANFVGKWISGQQLKFNFTAVQPGYHSFVITATVAPSVIPGQQLSNLVNLNHTDNAGFEMTGSSSWANCTVARPTLTIAKAAVTPDVYPGSVARFAITVTNIGTDAAGWIWVNDTLQAGLTFVAHNAWALAAFSANESLTANFVSIRFYGLGVGASLTFWLDARVAITQGDDTYRMNTARCAFTSVGGYRLPEEPVDSALIHITRPAVSVQKAVDRSGVYHGQTLTYTIWFNNSGHAPAGDIWINDTLPNNVLYQGDTSGLGVGQHQSIGLWHSWHFTNVAVGARSFTITVLVLQSAPINSWLYNEATWNYTSPNGINPGTATATSNQVSTLVLGPIVSLSKIVDAATAQPGQPLTYTIYFNNTGNSNARVWLNDTLPLDVTYAGHTAATTATHTLLSWGRSGQNLWFNFTNVQPGNHWFTVTVRVNNNAQNGTWANNTATCDFVAANGYHYDRLQDGAITLIFRPMVVVQKTADIGQATIGDTIVYTIWFNNTDDVDASYVWLNDTLPPGVTYVSDTSATSPTASPYFWANDTTGNPLLFEFRDLPPGDYSFTITVAVDYFAAPPADFTAENVATCDVATPWATIDHSEASASTQIVRPWITVGKIGPAIVSPGATVQFTIFFNNIGPSAAAFVWINETFFGSMLWVSDSAAAVSGATFGGRIGTPGPVIQYLFTNVQPGAHSFVVNVTIDPTVAEGASLWNNVTLDYTTSSSQANVDLERSWRNVSLTATGVSITVQKLVSAGTATPGDFLNYTVFFNNLGSENAAFVWLNDTLPAGVVYVGNTSAGVWGATLVSSGRSGQNMWFNFTNVQPGAHWFTITVRVSTSGLADGQPLRNRAYLNYTNANGNMEAPSSASALTVVSMPNITVAKSVNATLAYAGTSLTYTIWFNNTGNGTAAFVWLNDTLPAGVTYIGNTSATVAGATLVSSGRSGQSMWFNFTDVLTGAHSFTITVAINGAAANNTLLANRASLNYTDLNRNIYPWSQDWANTTVLNLPYIVVEKAVNQTSCSSGDALQYTIWFNNTGPATSALVEISDVLPVGATYVSNSSMSVAGATYASSGASGQYLWFNFTNVLTGVHSFVINVTGAGGAGTFLTNWAFLNYTDPTGTIQLPWSQDSATTVVTNVAIIVVKTASVPTADPSDPVQYTITFDNDGTAAAGTVSIADVLPIGVTYVSNSSASVVGAVLASSGMSGQYLWFNFTNVQPGAHSFLVNVTVNAGVADRTPLRNWVFLNYTDMAANPLLRSQSSALTTVTAPVVLVSKVPDMQYADPGDIVTYTITFVNTGSGVAASVWIVDTLQAGLAYVSNTSASVAGAILVSSGRSGQYLWFNFTNVQQGAHSFVLRARVQVGLADGIILRNTAGLNCTDANGNLLPQSVDVADVTVTAPSMSMAKTAAPTNVYPGEYVNFTIIFQNSGAGAASFVWLNDTLPGYCQYITHSASSIPYYLISTYGGGILRIVFRNLPTGLYSFTITVKILTNAPDGVRLDNAARLDSTDANGNKLAQRTDNASVWVRAPSIAVQKTVSDASVYPNQTVAYEIYFDNMGSGNASKVWINDTMPLGVTLLWHTAQNSTTTAAYYASGIIALQKMYLVFNNVTPGSHSFTIFVRINTNLANGAVLRNTAWCNYTAVTKYQETKAWADVTVSRPTVDVAKSVSQAVSSPGDVLTYYIWLNGTGAVAPDLWFNDTLPNGVTYLWDSAAGVAGFVSRTIAGQNLIIHFQGFTSGVHFFTITVRVSNDTVTLLFDGWPLLNSARIEYRVPTYGWNATASVQSFVRFPTITVEKYVDKSVAYPTEVLKYTIRVRNTGSVASPIVWVRDTMPTNAIYLTSTVGTPSVVAGVYTWTFYNMAAKGTIEFNVWVRVSASAPNNDTVDNLVRCDYTFTNGLIRTTTDASTSTRVIRPVITVEKIALQPTAYPGEVVTFVIYFNNTMGSGTAYRVWINDTLPVGLTYEPGGTTPGLVAGQSLGWLFRNVGSYTRNQLTVMARVGMDVPARTVLTDTAFLNYTGPSQSGYLKFEETRDTASITVISPHIVVEKTVNAATANPGDMLTYALYFNNTGNGAAVNTVIEDTLPEWVAYVSDDSGLSHGTFGRTLTWDIGALPVGPHVFNVTVRITSDFAIPDRTLLVNEVACSYATPTGQSWTTADSAETMVIKPIVSLTKTAATGVAGPGDVVRFTITLSNTGSDLARLLWLNDTLPAHLIYAGDSSASVTGMERVSMVAGAGQIRWTFANVTPGTHSFEVNFTVNVSMLDDSVSLNAVTSAYIAPNGVAYPNLSASAYVHLRRPFITVQKTVDNATVAPGGVLNYTIWFNNTGSGVAGTVWLNDTLPAMTSYVSDTSGAAVQSAGQVLRWILLGVVPGPHSFSVIVNVSSTAYGTLVNNVTCGYAAVSGFFLGSSSDEAVTVVGGAMPTPPEITTVPITPVWAGFDVHFAADVTDDEGVDTVMIYYVDIEGVWGSGEMVQSAGNFTTGIGAYEYQIDPQTWKGIVSYFVWANDTRGLWSMTGWNDVVVILPPYIVWGNVVSNAGSPVANAMVLVINNATNDTALTVANNDGVYEVDLADMDSGYQIGQDLTLFGTDLLYYGFAYTGVDVSGYSLSPEMPPSADNPNSFPYDQVDIILNEIPEYGTVAFPLLIVLALFAITRRRGKRGAPKRV